MPEDGRVRCKKYHPISVPHLILQSFGTSSYKLSATPLDTLWFHPWTLPGVAQHAVDSADALAGVPPELVFAAAEAEECVVAPHTRGNFSRPQNGWGWVPPSPPASGPAGPPAPPPPPSPRDDEQKKY